MGEGKALSRKPTTALGAPPEQIKQFHRSNTVHAKLRDYDVNMRDIGGIDIGQGQSPHMHDIYLATEISLGFVRVPFESQSYEWSMSGVNIVLDLENAEVIVGSYYQRVLQDGDLVAKQKEAEHDSLNSGSQREGEAEAKLSWKAYLPVLFAGARGKLRADRKHSRDQTSDSQITVTPTIVLVQKEGERSLRAGSRIGDPRLVNTRDLRGPIVSPYGPAKLAGKGKNEDEVPTPLVRLRACDSSKPVLGLITVRAEPEDFVLNASKQHEPTSLALAEALRKDKVNMVRRKLAAEQNLRRRVAALAATKANPDTQDQPGGRQFDLFSCAFCVEPMLVDETDGQG